MVNYIIRKPLLSDIDYFDKNARQSDKDEIFLFSGRTIAETLNDTPGLYENSDVWVVEDKIVAIFGVSEFDGKNIIWMIATDHFDKYSNIFRNGCKEVFEKMIKGRDYLYNFVHFKHKKAIKWLKWLGAEFSEPLPIGLNGELFCNFEIRN